LVLELWSGISEASVADRAKIPVRPFMERLALRDGGTASSVH
jgi:hypothetical protein